MDSILSPQEREDKRKGRIATMIVHVVLVILLFIPFLKYPDPPPGQEGILVNLGLPDVGQGEENAAPSQPSAPEVRDEPEVLPEAREQPKPSEVEPALQEEVVTTEDPEAEAIRKEQEKERRERERQEQLDRERREAEEEARRQAEVEAKRKAEEEARKKAEAESFKDKIGGLFGGGEGKGNTGKEGNQGDPEGNPDAERLEGISTGSGTVGGGLGGRGVQNSPPVSDNSQNQGTVVVSLCVNADGQVTSAEYTQRGSTTANATLKKLAIDNAKKWRFTPSDIDKQCGTITYRFRVQ